MRYLGIYLVYAQEYNISFIRENLTSPATDVGHASFHRVCGFLVVLTFTTICFVFLMSTIFTKIRWCFNLHFADGEPDWKITSSVYWLIFYHLRTVALNCFSFFSFPHKEISYSEAIFCGSGLFELSIYFRE